ncbi:nitroreductase/quinone reductase family protein [Nocardioides sp. YIM 152588]|uniref:nitroreductase/quinone reductase family protein n=1 Tax=Nocardioides sp. YIM 152588 TaxID=3158259 RepID=UPI0032E3BB88
MADRQKQPFLPPRWFVTNAWKAHRALYRRTKGRKGLWPPSDKRGWGALRLTAVGRRSGEERSVIVGYLEEGPDLVLMAMNGWGEGEPQWWRNLQAEPRAAVRLADGTTRRVRAHAAEGEERERLWQRWRGVEPRLDDYAALRSTPTDVVVLAPEVDAA